MYNAIVSWIKNNLIYNADSKTISDQEFNSELRKTIKGYNNTFTISEALIAPEESLITMDIEIGGQHVKTIQATHVNDKNEKEGSHIILTNEKGDILKQTQKINENKPRVPVLLPQVTEKVFSSRTRSKTELTYKELISQECTQKQVEKFEELKREKGQSDENAEVLGIPLPFRSVGERSSLTNLHNLMEQCPQPQPPLINKQLKTLQLNADQAIIMAEQVQRMKTGMERLQEIIRKFNCTEKFKQDIDFIIANVGPAIAKAEQMRRSEQAIYKTHKRTD
ncbi:hypothetical protein ILUMI_23326 [Ignelater luminosus]|uniref:Uncharacterized protein n=1 Tax=Ignelater luminosus TaxID=2038154 RepID=A0A8K0CB27_IGNLU|nr:hypothetical protein ILUMI_23326 [Ignelater luminosus]